MSIAAKVLLWTVALEANCLCCLADNERCIFVVPFCGKRSCFCSVHGLCASVFCLYEAAIAFYNDLVLAHTPHASCAQHFAIAWQSIKFTCKTPPFARACWWSPACSSPVQDWFAQYPRP